MTQSKYLESIEMVGIVSVFDILMYNIRPYLFCGGLKGILSCAGHFRYLLRIVNVY